MRDGSSEAAWVAISFLSSVSGRFARLSHRKVHQPHGPVLQSQPSEAISGRWTDRRRAKKVGTSGPRFPFSPFYPHLLGPVWRDDRSALSVVHSVRSVRKTSEIMTERKKEGSIVKGIISEGDDKGWSGLIQEFLCHYAPLTLTPFPRLIPIASLMKGVNKPGKVRREERKEWVKWWGNERKVRNY